MIGSLKGAKSLPCFVECSKLGLKWQILPGVGIVMGTRRTGLSRLLSQRLRKKPHKPIVSVILIIIRSVFAAYYHLKLKFKGRAGKLDSENGITASDNTRLEMEWVFFLR